MSCSAQETIVKGHIKDAQTQEALPFASVVFTKTGHGVVTDIDGYFELNTDDPNIRRISISFIGYKTTIEKIIPLEIQTIEILLPPDAQVLDAVVIKGSKRVKKDTAAITLFRRVRAQAEARQIRSYAYEDYTKTEFDLYNIKEKLTKRKILKPFDFIFENIDTTEEGNTYLPLMLKEKLMDVYYSSNPKGQKQIIKASQFSGIDDIDQTEMVEQFFTEFRVYEKVMVLGDKAFNSPFGKGALLSYKYFLTDTAVVENDTCYRLQFAPRRKQDLCFVGFAWIEKESAAIKSIDLEVLKQINLNFVSDFRMKQRFKRVEAGEKQEWFKYYDQMTINLNPLQQKKKRSVRVVQTSSRSNIQLNKNFAADKITGDNEEVEPLAYERGADYWAEHRHTDLDEHEQHIYSLVDRVQETRAYRYLEWMTHASATGFFRFGPLEFGKHYQFYSINALEGHRFKLGARLTRQLFKESLEANTYLAWGTKDRQFKYHVGIRKHLKRVNKKWHMVGGMYRYDWSDYASNNMWTTHDYTLVTVFRKTPLDNLFLIRKANLFYEREWVQGWMTRVAVTHKNIYSWPGTYEFSLPGEAGAPATDIDKFQVVDLSFYSRLAIGEKFFANADGEQRGINLQSPVLEFTYTISPLGLLGSDYNYQTLSLGLSHRFATKLGQTIYQMQGGKVFGRVPYPLLHIHKGNESFGYDKRGFNLMNEQEYASDVWASFHFQHRFDGLIFNAIPVIRRLKLRSMIDFRAATGSVSTENRSYMTVSNGLGPINGVYAEAGVGISNIARMMSVGFMWRLTQRDKAEVSHFGIKMRFSPSF